MKMKFKHFERISDNTTKAVAITPGYQLYGEDMDDIDIKLTIDSNGDIQTEVVGPIIDFVGHDCTSELNDTIKSIPINWENGYEYIDYFDIVTKEKLELIGDWPSDTFKALNSQKNIDNINNFKKALKNI